MQERLKDRFLSEIELYCFEHSRFNEYATSILDSINPRPEGPRTWELWAALESVNFKGKNVIDFGSYCSATPFVLSSAGAKVTASDTLQWPDDRPECNYPCTKRDWLSSLETQSIKFEKWSHEDIPQKDKSFYMATSISTLEHVNDWRKAVREMIRVSQFHIITIDCSCEGSPYVGYDRLFSKDEVEEIATMIHGKESKLSGDCSVCLPKTNRSLAVIRNIP